MMRVEHAGVITNNRLMHTCYQASWTGITENAERQIRHNCTPLQIVHQIPNVKNKNEAL